MRKLFDLRSNLLTLGIGENKFSISSAPQYRFSRLATLIGAAEPKLPKGRGKLLRLLRED